MQDEVTFVIDENGDSKYLLTDAAKDIDLGGTPRRASHVEPNNVVFRVLFHILRRWLGDKGRMSNFTRAWPILWRVNLQPIGGPVIAERYFNRRQAINAEVVAINKFWTGELR